MPKVSVLMPNYNKALFVESAVQSVLAQTFADWELIIVDDCSTDGSKEVLTHLGATDHRIRVLYNEKNLGGNKSRNRAIGEARGDYAVFLDSDDLLATFCLENRIMAAQSAGNFDLNVFPMTVFKETPGDQPSNLDWIPREGLFLNGFLCHRLPWQTMQPIWRMNFLKELGGFDEAFVRLQDVELHTRALMSGARVKVHPDLLPDCFFRTDDARFSAQMLPFLEKFVEGARQYYQKFFPVCNAKQRKLLSCTLLETLSNIASRRRQGHITEKDAKTLSTDLIDACQLKSHQRILWFYCKADRVSPIHPRGLKKLTSILLGLG